MIQIYIPSVLTGADCKCFTELFPIIPFISRTPTYGQITDAAGVWNEGLYSKLFLNELQNIIRVDNIAYCDVVILPFKYDPNDQRVETMCAEAASYKKQVIAFYNDDNGTPWQLPANLKLFRTSTTRTELRSNEGILPVLIPDHKPTTLLLADMVNDHNIGFCGHIEGIRTPIVEKLKSLSDTFEPIIRQGFWAPGMCKVQARREYYTNMRKNSYTLCMRGGGNFSYRFYEALSFGRVPILIDTDMVLPGEGIIPWDSTIVRIPIADFLQMDQKQFTDLLHSKQISPLRNREIWEQWLSPEGYLDNLLYYEITQLLHSKP